MSKSRLQNVRLPLATQVSISLEFYRGAGNTSSFTVFYILSVLKYVSTAAYFNNKEKSEGKINTGSLPVPKSVEILVKVSGMNCVASRPVSAASNRTNIKVLFIGL